ncbi:hypothetical protein N7603_03505 [Acholeplasma vituli]|uniref:Uncharacterized protein n=1 Tax=Paracholeplasma vituli TaxID=69473 RepID=A0ABT2PWB3_9MOLU|nr:hypothetical protein [Paracholeplasma vituli]MCU0104716.1 hypothetical protein [Paracholeplasma vituli]
MNKMSYDEFKKVLQMVTSHMSDDDKFEFYQELLDTGSACVSERTIEHNFAIINGLHYEEVIFTPTDNDDELEIDLKEIELQADSIENEDVTEMTDVEIMQIGINPWTHEKVDFNYLQKRLDDFIRIFQERLQNDTLEITIAHNRENLTHFNFIKTIVAFYQEQTKDSNKPKVNGSTYPDLHIQWRLDDLNQGDEMPRLVSIEPNEDRAFDYWLIHDRTNGDTKEIVIKANELGEYDISEFIEYISERVNNERFDW